ncbi:immunoglobulin kappa light chain-like [Spea bombifrons]|uniref:immunoglobulin kappa light chain-like n=1 Tax=Spea bombifrons TaxID=233779 RepID=UPI002349356D|nr:immunoglobulin kappa light chain-like [Spea bombifrons]XP_053329447.1 immunoglobulin kappa light chain-like [Spea bombifrons]
MKLLVLSLCLCCSLEMPVHQEGRVSAPAGSTATLGCRVDGEENLSIHWFKQLPGAAPTYVLSHGNDSRVQRSKAFGERFQPIRSGGANFLQIAQVTTHDSGVYWCLPEKEHVYPVWGNGTHLSVFGGWDVSAPSVTLLTSGPPREDMSVFHVLCLVSNFYPPVIEVTWKVGGQSTPGEGTLGASPSGEENSYTLASVLELPARRGLSVSCEVRHDSSRTLISKDIHDCYPDILD